jgi:hypothetical protein
LRLRRRFASCPYESMALEFVVYILQAINKPFKRIREAASKVRCLRDL